MHYTRWLVAACVILALCLAGPGAFFAQDKADPDVLHIGIVDSLVKDLSPGKRKLVDKNLPDLVKDFTGYRSRVFQGGETFEAGKKLAAGKWHLAILPGVELAWLRSRDAKIEPILVAIDKEPAIHAVLMVNKESAYKDVAALKGKEVYVEDSIHCRLFADKLADGSAAKFFGKVLAADNVEAALDGILLGKVEGAVVEESDLDIYKEIHPGRFRRLKALARSEAFPPVVVAYRAGALSEGVLKRLGAGMLRANETVKGRDALADVGLTAFRRIPDDFPTMLRNIAKAYPPPKK